MTNHAAGSELRGQLDALWRSLWLIVLLVVLGVGGALALTLQQPEEYTATARLLLVADDDDEIDVETESQRVASVPVAELVAEELDAGGDPSDLLNSLAVSAVSDEADVLLVTYTSEEAAEAADVANAFAESYITYTDRQQTELSDAIQATEVLIDNAREDLEENFSQIAVAESGDQAARVAALEAERVLLSATLSTLQQRLTDAQLAENAQLSSGEILAPAEVPSSTSSPDLVQNLVVAGLIALAVGVLIAFVRAALQAPPAGSSSGKRRPPPPPR